MIYIFQVKCMIRSAADIGRWEWPVIADIAWYPENMVRVISAPETIMKQRTIVFKFTNL